MGSNSPWLVVIAISTAVQALILVGIAISAFRVYRLATTALERLERETVAPLVARSHQAVDRFEKLVDRIEEADDQVRTAIAHTSEKVAHAASLVGTKFWPILGVGRGALAAFSAFTSRRDRRSPRVPGLRPGRDRPLLEDETRFVYEGGIDHARS